ncbi:MAG: radical SAM protein, partial [Bacteroidota bacterium]|nr:radical SAM protein [Bacteroidota bacterium]
MHCNIPIFIPHLACPHACIFCNQRHISGQTKAPTIQEVKQTIGSYLSTIKEGSEVEVAFFGGSFTGIDIELQNKYLQAVQPYIKEGKVKSIRLSTRPDYINEEILLNLKQHNVLDIELGAQSLDNEVLFFSERGHRAEDVFKASEMIKNHGFKLGLQMMIGLPLDSKEKSINTAKTIVELGAKTTRIYPTLVIEQTFLAQLYREGKYSPLSIEEAVDWTKEVYKIFANSDVKVLRVGLHPSKDLISGAGYLAGPFHVSFFELVLSSIWRDRLLNINKIGQNMYVNPKDINYVIGYKSKNKDIIHNLSLNIKQTTKVKQ